MLLCALGAHGSRDILRTNGEALQDTLYLNPKLVLFIEPMLDMQVFHFMLELDQLVSPRRTFVVARIDDLEDERNWNVVEDLGLAEEEVPCALLIRENSTERVRSLDDFLTFIM